MTTFAWILDIIVFVLLVYGAFMGGKRGFVKTAIIATKGLLSLLVALLLTKPCSGLFSWLDLPTAIIRIITFVVLFLLMKLVLRFVADIISKLFDVPFLRGLNKWLGVALGLIIAIVRIIVFCLIVNSIINLAHTIGIDALSNLSASGTVLFNWFSRINIFDFIF